MFETRKQLKLKISELEILLQKEQAINDLVEKSGLGKCKGIMCKSCEHSVYINSEYGTPRLIGCDLTVSCPDYKKKTRPELFPNALQEM